MGVLDKETKEREFENMCRNVCRREEEIRAVSLEDFAQVVKVRLQEICSGSCQVKLSKVLKNNGKKLLGITVMNPENNISPTIYLEPYFERYKTQETIGGIVREILEVYEQYKVEEKFDVDSFSNFETVKGNIVYKLVNAQRNEELLSQVPHVRYLDLAVVFYYIFQDFSWGSATAVIYQSHLDLWKTDLETVYKIAKQNTPSLLPHKIQNMRELMVESFRADIDKYIDNLYKNGDILADEKTIGNLAQELTENLFGKENDCGMYVLSNTAKQYGAACILYEDVLQDFADIVAQNLYVLPSSIHEVILIPEQEVENPSGLRRMVMEVNEEELSQEELLSDSVYFYDRSCGQLLFAQGGW